MNQVPKDESNCDLYFNLVANNDKDNKFFEQLPRVGAFEVSYKGQFIFSKFLVSKWPNLNLIAGRCEKIVEAMQRGVDHTPYLANALQGDRGAKRPGEDNA